MGYTIGAWDAAVESVRRAARDRQELYIEHDMLNAAQRAAVALAGADGGGVLSDDVATLGFLGHVCLDLTTRCNRRNLPRTSGEVRDLLDTVVSELAGRNQWEGLPPARRRGNGLVVPRPCPAEPDQDGWLVVSLTEAGWEMTISRPAPKTRPTTSLSAPFTTKGARGVAELALAVNRGLMGEFGTYARLPVREMAMKVKHGANYRMVMEYGEVRAAAMLSADRGRR
jgi:hypothetical protein